MAATPASVRACSFTGQFDNLSDATIELAIAEAALHYGTLVSHRGAKPTIVDKLTSLHAAHLLHIGQKEEAGENADDQPGPVKSASLDRVGSWSFGAAGEGINDKGEGPLTDWKSSPYGRRWRGVWRTLPTAVLAIPGPDE